MTDKAMRIVLCVALGSAFVLACGFSFLFGWQMAPEAPAVAVAGALQVPIDGKLVTLPTDREIVIEAETLDEAYAIVRQIQESGASKGSAVQESGSEIKGTWEQAPPTVNTSLGGASGGGVSFDYSALTRVSVTSVLAAIGALAIIGGAGLFFTGRKMLGLGVAVGGLVCATAAFLYQTYPLTILAVAILAIAGVGYMIWRNAKGRDLERDSVALKAVVMGIENAEDTEDVKKEIGKVAAANGHEHAIKAAVKKAKE